MSFLTFRSAKRKAKKISTSVVRRPPPRSFSPDSFHSPYVVEISESGNDTYNLGPQPREDHPLALTSPQVALEFSSEPLFPSDIFVSHTDGEGSDDARRGASRERPAGGSSSGAGSIGASRSWPDGIHEAGNDATDSASNLDLSNAEDDVATKPPRKALKAAPTPIRIPAVSRHAKLQVQRSAGKSAAPSAFPPHLENVDSPVTGDDASAISGFTLAGALAANAFSMQNEPSDTRRSRHVTRKDSATLPIGYWKQSRKSPSEHDGGATSGLDPSIPPLPPLPLRTASLTLDIAMGSSSFGEVALASEPSHADADDAAVRRLARNPATPPLSRTPSSARFFDNEQHPGQRRVSPIAEAPTPSPATPEQTKAPSSSTSSSGPASSTGTNPQRTGASDTSLFLSPNSGGRPSPYSDLSSRSGTDINQVLDNFGSPSIDGKNPLTPERKVSSGSPSPSGTSVRVAAERTSSSRQRGKSSLLEARISNPRRPSMVSVNSILHPSTLLPIGDRRGSTFSASAVASSLEERDTLSAALPSFLGTTHSQHISQLPSFPESANLPSATFSPGIPPSPGQSPAFPPTPDLFDNIIVGDEGQTTNNGMRRPSGALTILADPRDPSSYDIAVGESSSPANTTPSTGTGKQTFPETPDAFSPIFSPNASATASRSASFGPSALRTVSVNRGTRGRSARLVPRVVSRSSSLKSRKRSLKSKSSKASMVDSLAGSEGTASGHAASSTTMSKNVDISSRASGSSAASSATFGVTRQRSASLRRGIPPAPVAIPPPPPPLPPAPRLAPTPTPPPAFPEAPSSVDSAHSGAPPPPYQSVANGPGPTSGPSGSVANRRLQGRPPLPIGPRNRNVSGGPGLGLATTTAGRSRNGSSASLLPQGDSLQRSTAGSVSSRSGPRFQPKGIAYKGYTMEAAKWTFSSEQLQSIVSTAIRQSAEASSIRLLPPQQLNVDVPQEIDRLAAVESELKVKHKLQVRRRETLLSSISAQLEGQEGAYTIRSKLDDVAEVSDNLDQIADDLYTTRDQAAQLDLLMAVHSASALAMALRKLNTSFLKRTAEVQGLRQHIAALEAERDEAWSQAQQVAQDLDDLNESIQDDSADGERRHSRSHSRHSSRVMASRKSSLRASKAGLRSSRSHRGSMASQVATSRMSYMSSAGTPSFTPAEVPPVPRIPLHRNSIGIVTTGLSSHNSGMYNSGFSSTSESHALAQAQMDLYRMLGLPIQEAKDPRTRRSSLSQLTTPSSGRLRGTPTGSPRPVSDGGGHRRTQSLDALEALISDDHQAVLATLHMIG
ncbi:hypothetical protein FA95DRAFT_1389439 [Auriscalpium vulgare]|uniref:Uncharacterized protein n=1 Tax=Auriscalpium vulgare TaxID=40419 RepID=A0ACB8S7U4_9AGAM|nr:hypothetical protein FA95DRAFT_1389439 [Auriscalpium vulgare]